MPPAFGYRSALHNAILPAFQTAFKDLLCIRSLAGNRPVKSAFSVVLGLELCFTNRLLYH
jgi:hypothetical protein